jgi:hypothetical protein
MYQKDEDMFKELDRMVQIQPALHQLEQDLFDVHHKQTRTGSGDNSIR